MSRGAGFAVSVVGIMFSEQTLMNAGVLIVAASAGGTNITGGLTGFVFNIMLIVRAPLQLFQAIQTSILPHLAGWRPASRPTSSATRSTSPCSRSPPSDWRSRSGCW